MRLISFVALSTFMFSLTAAADEQMRLLTQSGAWVTMAHSETMLSHPDMCLTMNTQNSVAFRAAEEGVELRVMNENWTLPMHVSGDIHVAVGKISRDVHITSNTDSMVSGSIDSNDVEPLFGEMDKQATMTLIVGKSKPLIVSLSGSTVATNAFRTCAGIHGAPVPNSNNPFN